MSVFRNKVAIVTGGGSGIGRALAEELVRRGASVEAMDIDAGRACETADRITSAGGTCRTTELDVTDAAAVEAAAAGVADRHGRVDFMFNNAGIAVCGQARDLSLKDWQDVIGVNLFGVINGVRAVYPVMIKQRSGHIVNTASVEGLVPFACNLPYTASKFAVVGLSRGLRTEASQHGVKVSVACPGYTDTAIFGDSRMVNMDRNKVMRAVGFVKPLPVKECARRILDGVARNQPVIVVSDPARFAWFMSRLSPELTQSILTPRLRILLDARTR